MLGRRSAVALASAAGMWLAVLVPARAATARPPASRTLAEKDANLDESLQVADRLRAAGIDVRLTRSTDVFVPLGERTGMANAFGADRFVSIHNNASKAKATRGTEVYAQVGRAGSISLAARVLNEVTARSGTVARGVFQRPGRDADYYFVLRNSPMPAVIVEGAYVSNPAECAALAGAGLRRAIADGVAVAVAGDLGPLPLPLASTVAAPKASPLGEYLERPGSVAATGDRSSSTLAWDTVPKATSYQVWRDGELVGEVQTSTDAVPVRELAGEDTGPPRVSLALPGLPPGVHRYEVRARLVAQGQVVEESESVTTEVTVPWRVVVDAGHGGRDTGALGSYRP